MTKRDSPYQLPTLTHPPDWMDQANCRSENSDLFFATKTNHIQQAKAICNTCPAKQNCLDHALKHINKYPRLEGIWGGTTLRERRHLASGDPQ